MGAAASVVLGLCLLNRARPAGVDAPLQMSKARHEKCNRFPQRILNWAVAYVRQVLMRGGLQLSKCPWQKCVREVSGDEGY